MKIYNIKEKEEFLEEVATLTQKMWGSKDLTFDEFMVKSGYELSKRHRRKIYLPPQPLYRRSSDRQRAGDHPRQKYRQAQGTLNGRRDRLAGKER